MSAGSDDTNFLGRWAQRKAQARQKDVVEARTSPPDGERTAAQQTPTAETPEAFDLETLPKLDEITAETNMSDFLRKEAPESLRNAALRKAWALDPAIRDYVNPAMEYAWDWNAPGGVPGSGELEAGFDVAKAVARTFAAGRGPSADNPLVEGNASSSEPAPPEIAASVVETRPKSAPDRVAHHPVVNEEVDDLKSTSEPCAETSEKRAVDPSRLRKARARHGGATPV